MKAKFNIKVFHSDGTTSYVMAGYKLEVTESKGNAFINAMMKQEEFRGARFMLVRVG